MYALSARGTGSPSLMKDMKSDFLWRSVDGLVRGSREIGGVPKVRQWIRLKPLCAVSLGYIFIKGLVTYSQS